jgi:hypothetical protein
MAIHPLCGLAITIKPTHYPSTQYILFYAEKQLHVSAAKYSPHQAVHKGK